MYAMRGQARPGNAVQQKLVETAEFGIMQVQLSPSDEDEHRSSVHVAGALNLEIVIINLDAKCGAPICSSNHTQAR